MSEKFKKIIDIELKEIIPGFLENRMSDIVTLDKAIEISDFPSLRSIGHKLSGNAGGYGFDDLGEIGARLETAGEEENLKNASTEIKAIKAYMNNLEITYE